MTHRHLPYAKVAGLGFERTEAYYYENRKEIKEEMLVVRVKRNRDDDPAETICVVEGNHTSVREGNAKKRKKITFSHLSLNHIETEDVCSTRNNTLGEEEDSPLKFEGNRLILRRVSTIDHRLIQPPIVEVLPISNGHKQSLDDQTVSLLRKRGEADLYQQRSESLPLSSLDEAASSSVSRKRMKVIVAQRTKALPVAIAGKESCIIVDTTQIFQSPTVHSNVSSSSSSSKKKISLTKILDPPTRLLKQGILTAIQRNDFNDISSALLKGANPNYQLDLEEGGYTALMAASMKGNVRMVKRLLLHQVDVLAVNKDGLNAMDIIKKPTRSNEKDCEEIRQELHRAIEKTYYQKQLRNQSSLTDSFAASQTDENYVYDVYCVDAPSAKHVNNAVVHDKPSEVSPSHQPDLSSGTSIVQIDGLKILDHGAVELFEYDSDWSDLADDEDPDSNDERYYANDYPDEDSEEGGERYFRENDDDASYSSEEQYPDSRNKKSLLSRLNNLSARGSGVNQYPTYSERKARNKMKGQDFGEEVAGTEDADMEEENLKIDQELEEIMNEEIGMGRDDGHPIFDRKLSIGKVLRPHYLDSALQEADLFVNPPRHLDSETLRRIWGEETEENVQSLPEHDQRLFDMRRRTNMLFAANPREFNADGLPKYGAELSDDEANFPYTGGTMAEDEDDRPMKDMVAYDSELDKDSDPE